MVVPTPKASSSARVNRPLDVDIIDINEYLQLVTKPQDLFGDNHLKVRNLSITYIYQHCYGASPPVDWGGKNGTISRLVALFRIPNKKRRQVRRVLMEVWECIQTQTVYDDGRRRKAGRIPMISEGDVDETIIADWMEQGLGFRHTLAMVNQSRIERGLIHVGISALIYAFRRMKPVISKIRKKGQANVNNLAWAKARKNQCKQYLIMLGRITKETLLKEECTYPLPPWYDPDLLPKIDDAQLVWYDEMHIKQKVGLNIHADLQIRFPRNANGDYDSTSSSIAAPAYQAIFKYSQEARFCLGVAKIKQNNGTVKGVRSKVFDYSSKKIISIKEYDKRVKEEIRRVKQLKTTINSRWVSCARLKKSADPRLWEEDGLERIVGVGNTLITGLKKCEVNTVGELKYLAAPRLASLTLAGVKKKALESAIIKCNAALPGSCHINTIDHRQHDNPYQSKYPLDHKERIKQSSALKPFVVITDLVLWIMKESQRLMMGTVHEKDWYFYHDTLSPMTAEDTLK